MDHQHIFLIETIDGAYLDAVGVFTCDAIFVDDVCHWLSSYFILKLLAKAARQINQEWRADKIKTASILLAGAPLLLGFALVEFFPQAGLNLRIMFALHWQDRGAFPVRQF